MKCTIFYLVVSSLIISSLTENSTKLKDVLKKSKNNNTYDSEENDDIFRKEIINAKGQCSGNNSNSDDSNYQNYGNNQNYDRKYYGESHGRYNRNNRDNYQSFGYSSNSNDGRENSDSGTYNNQGYSTNSGYGYNSNRDSNYNGYSTGMPAYNSGYNNNGNSGSNYNGNMNPSNARNNYNGYNNRNQNGYYGIRNTEGENCENNNFGGGNFNRQRNNGGYDYGSYYNSNKRNSDITGYYNGRRIKRSDKMTREDKYSFQCASQCVFGHLEMLDDDQIPSETLFVKWIQEHIKNDDLKRIQTLREVRKCFAQMSTSDIEDGCDFSKELSKCLNLQLE